MSSEPGFRSVKVSLLWRVKRLCCFPGRESPAFTLRGREYRVSLTLCFDGYHLHLLGAGDDQLVERWPFETSVCCVVRGSSEYLKQTVVEESNFGRSIWSGSIPELREQVPGFDGEQFLLFRMIFSTRNSRDFLPTRPETGHKSVQTPAYWETDPCLSLDFGRLLDRQTDSRTDVELRCGGHTFRAHRSVLGARSEVFSRMLHTDMAEGRTGLVEVGDMDSGYFAEFLRYVYTGILPELTAGLAKALFEAGDKYAVGNLTRRCADFLSENMTPENALEYLLLADAHSDRDFKDEAVTYVLSEKIPLQDDRWLPFSNDHPKIAAEVLLCGFKFFCRE